MRLNSRPGTERGRTGSVVGPGNGADDSPEPSSVTSDSSDIQKIEMRTGKNQAAKGID